MLGRSQRAKTELKYHGKGMVMFVEKRIVKLTHPKVFRNTLPFPRTPHHEHVFLKVIHGMNVDSCDLN